MILKVFYLGREMLVDAGTDLVFDGTAFVSPIQAKYVALSVAGTATSEPHLYPIDYRIDQPQMQWTNHWVCKVISVEDATLGLTGTDVISIPSPVPLGPDGKPPCICGVTCQGTEVQNINVI